MAEQLLASKRHLSYIGLTDREMVEKYILLGTIVYEWAQRCRTLNYPVTDYALKQTARTLGKIIDLTDFRANNAWASKFKQTFKIICVKETSSNAAQAAEALQAVNIYDVVRDFRIQNKFPECIRKMYDKKFTYKDPNEVIPSPEDIPVLIIPRGNPNDVAKHVTEIAANIYNDKNMTEITSTSNMMDISMSNAVTTNNDISTEPVNSILKATLQSPPAPFSNINMENFCNTGNFTGSGLVIKEVQGSVTNYTKSYAKKTAEPKSKVIKKKTAKMARTNTRKKNITSTNSNLPSNILNLNSDELFGNLNQPKSEMNQTVNQNINQNNQLEIPNVFDINDPSFSNSIISAAMQNLSSSPNNKDKSFSLTVEIHQNGEVTGTISENINSGQESPVDMIDDDQIMNFSESINFTTPGDHTIQYQPIEIEQESVIINNPFETEISDKIPDVNIVAKIEISDDEEDITESLQNILAESPVQSQDNSPMVVTQIEENTTNNEMDDNIENLIPNYVISSTQQCIVVPTVTTTVARSKRSNQQIQVAPKVATKVGRFKRNEVIEVADDEPKTNNVNDVFVVDDEPKTDNVDDVLIVDDEPKTHNVDDELVLDKTYEKPKKVSISPKKIIKLRKIGKKRGPKVGSKNKKTIPVKAIKNYDEALQHLGLLEDFALVRSNFRAINFITSLEEIFRSDMSLEVVSSS